jgi:DNA-binding GntR family transcriptional regulator
LSAPHYLAVRDQIARWVGTLGVGAKLPSERELQAVSGAARGTIREALFQLEAEGVIYRRDRSGCLCFGTGPHPLNRDLVC